MRYELYVNEKDYSIKVKPARKAFDRVKVGEDILQFNENYYLSTCRKLLVEKAHSIKEMWVKDFESKLERVKAIKI